MVDDRRCGGLSLVLLRAPKGNYKWTCRSQGQRMHTKEHSYAVWRTRTSLQISDLYLVRLELQVTGTKMYKTDSLLRVGKYPYKCDSYKYVNSAGTVYSKPTKSASCRGSQVLMHAPGKSVDAHDFKT
jgi:hypothetical protein